MQWVVYVLSAVVSYAIYTAISTHLINLLAQTEIPLTPGRRHGQPQIILLSVHSL